MYSPRTHFYFYFFRNEIDSVFEQHFCIKRYRKSMIFFNHTYSSYSGSLSCIFYLYMKYEVTLMMKYQIWNEHSHSSRSTRKRFMEITTFEPKRKGQRKCLLLFVFICMYDQVSKSNIRKLTKFFPNRIKFTLMKSQGKHGFKLMFWR